MHGFITLSDTTSYDNVQYLNTVRINFEEQLDCEVWAENKTHIPRTPLFHQF